MTLITAQLFAANKDKNLIRNSQPYMFNANLANVEISIQILNNFNPSKQIGPARYRGKPIINMSISNNAAVTVNVTCEGEIMPKICTGTNITTCEFTDTTQTFNLTGTNLSITGVAPGFSGTVSYEPSTQILTTQSGWVLEVLNSQPLSCSITSPDSPDVMTKEYYLPVSYRFLKIT